MQRARENGEAGPTGPFKFPRNAFNPLPGMLGFGAPTPTGPLSWPSAPDASMIESLFADSVPGLPGLMSKMPMTRADTEGRGYTYKAVSMSTLQSPWLVEQPLFEDVEIKHSIDCMAVRPSDRVSKMRPIVTGRTVFDINCVLHRMKAADQQQMTAKKIKKRFRLLGICTSQERASIMGNTYSLVGISRQSQAVMPVFGASRPADKVGFYVVYRPRIPEVNAEVGVAFDNEDYGTHSWQLVPYSQLAQPSPRAQNMVVGKKSYFADVIPVGTVVTAGREAGRRRAGHQNNSFEQAYKTKVEGGVGALPIFVRCAV